MRSEKRGKILKAAEKDIRPVANKKFTKREREKLYKKKNFGFGKGPRWRPYLRSSSLSEQGHTQRKCLTAAGGERQLEGKKPLHVFPRK